MEIRRPLSGGNDAELPTVVQMLCCSTSCRPHPDSHDASLKPTFLQDRGADRPENNVPIMFKLLSRWTLDMLVHGTQQLSKY
jgi:hypothetical protein